MGVYSFPIFLKPNLVVKITIFAFFMQNLRLYCPNHTVFGFKRVASVALFFIMEVEKMVKIKGIDVSKHQGTIDWKKVKDSGIKIAILRVGYGSDIKSQDDSQFARNLAECNKYDISVGVYIYSYAKSVNEAKSEAQHVLRVLNGAKIDYPIFYDMEDDATQGKCNAKLLGDMADAFCSSIRNAGYDVGIYANKYWFTNKLTDSRFKNMKKWVAQYSSSMTCKVDNVVGWQYSSTGKVNGISGNVDMNEFYLSLNKIEYQAHIQNIGWQNVVSNGEMAGTTKKSLRMEALKIWADGINLKYRAHVQNIGWQDYVTSGQLCGTEGKSLRMEAVQIDADIPLKYRVHIQNLGWSEWYTNGSIAGTTGRSLRLEAIEIKLA